TAKRDEKLELALAAAGEAGGLAPKLQVKIGALHKRLALRDGGLGSPGIVRANRLHRTTFPVDARQGLLHMQRPRLSMRIDAIPVKQAKGGIAGLLHFGHQHTAAHSMNGAGRQEQAVTRLWLKVMKTIGDLTSGKGGAQLLFVDARKEASVNSATGRRIQHKPRLCFASFSRPEPLDGFLIW